VTDFERYFVTTDGDTLWLDHYPTDDDDTCTESPICSVEPGDTLAASPLIPDSPKGAP
jgi:hypothetical protein